MGHYESSYNRYSEEESFRKAEHRIKLRSKVIEKAIELKNELKHTSLKGEVDQYHASAVKDLINDMIMQNISDKAIVESYQRKVDNH